MVHYTPLVPQLHEFLKVRSWWCCHPFHPPGSWDRWVWWALCVAWWYVNRSRCWIAKRPAQKVSVWQSFKQLNSWEKKKKNCQEALLPALLVVPFLFPQNNRGHFPQKQACLFSYSYRSTAVIRPSPLPFFPLIPAVRPSQNTSFCLSQEVYLLLSQPWKDIPAWEEQAFFCIKCHLLDQK